MDVVRSSISLFFIVFFGFTTNAAAENDGDGEVFQWKLSEEVAGTPFAKTPSLATVRFRENGIFFARHGPMVRSRPGNGYATVATNRLAFTLPADWAGLPSFGCFATTFRPQWGGC